MQSSKHEKANVEQMIDLKASVFQPLASLPSFRTHCVIAGSRTRVVVDAQGLMYCVRVVPHFIPFLPLTVA